MEIKVGDKIYSINYGKVYSVMTIVRVTKTIAIADNGFKFKIGATPHGYAHKIEARSFSSMSYRIETDELKAMYHRQNICEDVKAFDFSSLTTEELESINEIIKNHQ